MPQMPSPELPSPLPAASIPAERPVDPAWPALRTLVVGLLAAVGLCWALVDPTGDFPLHDEWPSAWSVQQLLDQGRLRLCDWSMPLSLGTILAGALYARAFGFSYEVLRLSSVCWAALALLFAAAILREAGVRRPNRLLAAGVLGAYPVFFHLALTFHTDIAFLALCLGALWAYQRADRTGAPGAELAGAACATAATLTRQYGLLIPVCAVLWFAARRKLTPARGLRLAGLPILALGLTYAWITWSHGPTWSQVRMLAHENPVYFSDPLRVARNSALRLLKSLLYCALFALPYALSGNNLPPRDSRGRARWGVLLAAALGLAAFVWSYGAMPYMLHILTRRGLGSLTMFSGIGGATAKPAWLWCEPALWWALTLVGAVALWLLLARALARTPDAAQARLLCLLAPLCLAITMTVNYLDRYTLPLHALVILYFALGDRATPVRWFHWAPVLLCLLFSIAGSRDYFAWNRAKWELGGRACTRGLAPEEIENGLDWNGFWTFERSMAELRSRKPLVEIGPWDWVRVDLWRALIDYRPPSAADAEVLDSIRYTSPLAPEGATLHLYRLSPQAERRVPPPREDGR